MSDHKRLVESSFAAWSAGDGHISTLFADDMTWEIVGRSAASRRYPDAATFVAEVLEPFGRRFSTDDPFRPVNVRGVYEDGDTVIIVWDGRGTTTVGTEYANTYAWFLRLRDGEVVDGVAFYDSIAFDELWRGVDPGRATPDAP